ncbi:MULTISPECIES: hypothetical protein [Cyanophyceae]|nr:hypothetical protein [Trichocoleus sp. FACHB-69]MBD1935381.1 hypothetical protein [Trichocoleus sp. FACHB-69]
MARRLSDEILSCRRWRRSRKSKVSRKRSPSIDYAPLRSFAECIQHATLL